MKFSNSNVRSISSHSGRQETSQQATRNERGTSDGSDKHRAAGAENDRRPRGRLNFTWDFVFKLSVTITVTVTVPTAALKVLSSTDLHRIWQQSGLSEPDTRPTPTPPRTTHYKTMTKDPTPSQPPAVPALTATQPAAPKSWCMGLIDQIEARQRMGSRTLGVETIRQEFAEHRCELYGLSAP